MLETALVAGSAIVLRSSIAAAMAAVGIIRVPTRAAPSGVAAKTSWAAVLADLRSSAQNSGLRNAFARLEGERNSDLGEEEGRKNIDVAQVGAAGSTFVRERANDGVGFNPIFMSDLHPVTSGVLHLAARLTFLPGTPLALRTGILCKMLGFSARHRAGVTHGENQERHRRDFKTHRTGLVFRIEL